MNNTLKIVLSTTFAAVLFFACSKAQKTPQTNEEIAQAIQENNIKGMTLWLENGGDVNQSLDHQQSPLYIATGPKGGKEALELLLEKGAKVDVGAGKYTPLMNAASWVDLESVRLLLAKGADKTLTNEDGKTAYDLIGKCGNCPEFSKVKALLKTDGTGATFEGTFSYMADANIFISCNKLQRMPIEMEGEYLALERAYTNSVDGGQPIYVRLKGYTKEVPAMEGDDMVTAIVITQILEIDKDKNCPDLPSDGL